MNTLQSGDSAGQGLWKDGGLNCAKTQSDSIAFAQFSVLDDALQLCTSLVRKQICHSFIAYCCILLGLTLS